MPLSNSQDGDTALREHVRSLQKEIGIDDDDFLENLFREPDDWSFVIKLNALVEGALTHVVVESLNRPELRDALANTDLANTKSGKIVFASALGLLTSDERRFIIKLAEMRNAFVHDVRRVRVSIPEYVDSLEAGERKGFLKAMRYFAASDATTFDLPGRPGLSIDKFVAENLKLAIWFSAMNLIAVVYVHKESANAKREMERRIHAANEAMVAAIYKAATDGLTNAATRVIDATVPREPR